MNISDMPDVGMQAVSRHVKADLPDFEDHEKSQLRQILGAFRVSWRIPLLAGLIFLILAFAALGVARAIMPATTTFVSQFHFAFPTAQTGRYPNGARFSINEILDPAILNVIYDQLDLARYGIERERYYSAFSIRPFSLAEAEMMERFRQQMLDRRLVVVERERIEQQMRTRLELLSRGGAELSFSMRNRLPFSVEVGRAIVQKVPFEWARSAIEKRGVLRIPGFSGADELIVASAVESLPLPLRVVAVLQVNQHLEDRIADLTSNAGALTVRDPISGKSVRDLDRDIRDLQLYRLTPLRAALVAHRFDGGMAELEQVIALRVRDIDIAIAEASAQAKAVGDVLSQYVEASAGLKGTSIEKRNAGAPAAPGDTTIPQVSESFIDRIIALTRRDPDVEQAQEALLDDRMQSLLNLNKSAIALRSEQSRWKELLADLRADRPDRSDLDEATRGRISAGLNEAAKDANAIWVALSRIETEFAANRTGRTAEIYTSYIPEPDVITSDSILTWVMAGAVISAAALLWIGLWGCRAFLVLTRKGRFDVAQE